MTAVQLSAAFSIDVVDAIRALTAGITDTPVLDQGRWEQLVRRCAAVDSDVGRVVAQVDRRTSLLGLARRFRGEAARADQFPPLRTLIDHLVAGNGKTPSNDQIDAAVDQAAAWSHRTRRRAEIIQIAIDQLPTRLGIADRRWASQAGVPKREDACAMVPVESFGRWVRRAVSAGDVDALVQMAVADAVALDGGRWSGQIVPVPTTSAAVNTCRAFTWLLGVVDPSPRERAGLLLRAPAWREGIEACVPVREVITRIASGSALLSLSVS